MSVFHARWTMSVDIPHRNSPIRHAVELISEQEEQPFERKKAVGALLRWMRKHQPHPQLPEYAEKSYLPEPDNFSWQTSDAVFATHGIRVVREAFLWWPE